MWNTQNSSDPSDYWPNNLTSEQKKELFSRMNLDAVVNLRITLDREVNKRRAQAQQQVEQHEAATNKV